MLRPAARAAALAVLLASCGNNNTTTNPDGGTPGERKTETFSGTLTARAAMWHTFTVAASGTVDVTLSGLAPVQTTAVGMGIGTTPTNGCQVQAWNNSSTAGTMITAPINPGTFCVMVYDVGNVTDALTYNLTVVHP